MYLLDVFVDDVLYDDAEVFDGQQRRHQSDEEVLRTTSMSEGVNECEYEGGRE